ncbi:hypothetical protein BIW11_02722 [Tropilaelaps mercedesae]|uniref:Uncharacterized protein n=1 Tax=Tropilaelaps mercedesae TaxID=418985 RepID=A0A1V9XY89_9ACAR|nr:hypothetical protein BIW11_02722 [Tropilaelaps mercedesae]
MRYNEYTRSQQRPNKLVRAQSLTHAKGATSEAANMPCQICCHLGWTRIFAIIELGSTFVVGPLHTSHWSTAEQLEGQQAEIIAACHHRSRHQQAPLIVKRPSAAPQPPLLAALDIKATPNTACVFDARLLAYSPARVALFFFSSRSLVSLVPFVWPDHSAAPNANAPDPPLAPGDLHNRDGSVNVAPAIIGPAAKVSSSPG